MIRPWGHGAQGGLADRYRRDRSPHLRAPPFARLAEAFAPQLLPCWLCAAFSHPILIGSPTFDTTPEANPEGRPTINRPPSSHSRPFHPVSVKYCLRPQVLTRKPMCRRIHGRAQKRRDGLQSRARKVARRRTRCRFVSPVRVSQQPLYTTDERRRRDASAVDAGAGHPGTHSVPGIRGQPGIGPALPRNRSRS